MKQAAVIALTGLFLVGSARAADAPDAAALAKRILQEDGFWDVAGTAGFYRHQGGPTQLPFDSLIAGGIRGGTLGVGTLTDIVALRNADEFEFTEVPSGVSMFRNVFSGAGLIQRELWEFDATFQAASADAHLSVALTPADVDRARREHRVGVLIGLDTGAEIDEDLHALSVYQHLGLRKMALVHAVGTHWADAVSSKRPGRGGLSPFGRDVVKECNRLGIMVDLSHSSDQTFWDALAVSTRPLIATHSGSRAVSPLARNLTDPMLRALAAKGGMVGVCALFDTEEELKFEAGTNSRDFLSENLYLANKYSDPYQLAAALADPSEKAEAVKQTQIDPSKEYAYPGEHIDVPAKRAVLVRIMLDHLDHIVKVIGIDHVGIGTDLNMGRPGYPELVEGMVEGLVQRGYSRDQIDKILYKNFIAYFTAVAAGTPSDPRD